MAWYQIFAIVIPLLLAVAGAAWALRGSIGSLKESIGRVDGLQATVGSHGRLLGILIRRAHERGELSARDIEEVKDFYELSNRFYQERPKEPGRWPLVALSEFLLGLYSGIKGRD